MAIQIPARADSEIAASIRKAITDLNAALVEAAQTDLYVKIDSVGSELLGYSHRHRTFHATIERRVEVK